MASPSERERRFAAYLKGLADAENRAALAALRRGLGKTPGESADLFPYVVRWLPDDPWRESAFFLIASLFGLHPKSLPVDEHQRRATNLGASFRFVAADVAGTERRFVALLNAHRDDLPEHLRHAVALLKAHDRPIDWSQLLRDVQDWNVPSRSVQRAWARDFWRGTSDAATAPNEAVGPDTT